MIDSTGTNLQMFKNTYFFADEALPFFWNDRVYTTIDEWRAETGLDLNSRFFIGAFGSRAQVRAQNSRVLDVLAALDALRRVPTLRPEMFHALQSLAKERD